jgi:hypothetical protein
LPLVLQSTVVAINSMVRYDNNISIKFTKILNNNTKNLKITLKTNNHLITHLKDKTKHVTNYLSSFENAGINLNVIIINFI